MRRKPQQGDETLMKKKNIEKAFSHAYDLLKTEVIQNGQVIKLSHLTNVYNESLKKCDNAAAASEITSHNLRMKIEHFPELKDSIDFSSSPYKDTLVLCKSLEAMKAIVRSAYELGASDWIKKVSLDLHSKIMQAFKKKKQATSMASQSS